MIERVVGVLDRRRARPLAWIGSRCFSPAAAEQPEGELSSDFVFAHVSSRSDEWIGRLAVEANGEFGTGLKNRMN